MHLGQHGDQEGLQGGPCPSWGAQPCRCPLQPVPALPYSPGSAPARSCRSRASFHSPRSCTPPSDTSPRPGPAGTEPVTAPRSGVIVSPPPPPSAPLRGHPTSRRRNPCTVMMTKPWTELKTAKRTWKRMERRSVMASTADIQVSASRGRTTQELHSDALGQGERSRGEPTAPELPHDSPPEHHLPSRKRGRSRPRTARHGDPSPNAVWMPCTPSGPPLSPLPRRPQAGAGWVLGALPALGRGGPWALSAPPPRPRHRRCRAGPGKGTAACVPVPAQAAPLAGRVLGGTRDHRHPPRRRKKSSKRISFYFFSR